MTGIPTNIMHKPGSAKALIILISLSLVGCTSMSLTDLFSGYSKQMKSSRTAQQVGDFVKAEAAVADVSSSHNNYGLSHLEKGRLQFLAKNWSNSQKNFEIAYEQVAAQDQAAKIQLSKGLKQAGAVMTNDNAIAYKIPSYEQGMLHTYQALNYLYQGNLEGALVEVRRANLVQERALKDHQDELFEAQEEMSEKGVSNDKLNSAYPSMDSMIGDVKNGFQNAYTFYLSGVLWEATGEPNSAYIDYKRAIEIFPNNSYLQQDVLRLATKLDMADDLVKFERRFGKYQAAKQSGEVVFLYDQDIVNPKEEVKINLPIFSSDSLKVFSFALPVYRNGFTVTRPLSTTINGINYRSEEIVRIQSLASKHLKDQLPGMVTRQALRLVAKEQVRQQASKKGDDLGNILVSLYNIASENADTRSWSSLPNNVQILRAPLAAGKQQLQVSIGGKQQLIEIDVNPNSITLVNFTAIGGYTGYKAITF